MGVNHGGLGRSRDATLSLHGLPRPTPVSGRIYIIRYLQDFDIKILYVLCFQHVYVL